MKRGVLRNIFCYGLFGSLVLSPVCWGENEIIVEENIKDVILDGDRDMGKSFDELTEPKQREEEWPGYMKWMCDLNDRAYDFKIAINSLSNGLSNQDTNIFYLDPNLNEKEVRVYLYKHKF